MPTRTSHDDSLVLLAGLLCKDFQTDWAGLLFYALQGHGTKGQHLVRIRTKGKHLVRTLLRIFWRRRLSDLIRMERKRVVRESVHEFDSHKLKKPMGTADDLKAWWGGVASWVHGRKHGLAMGCQIGEPAAFCSIDSLENAVEKGRCLRKKRTSTACAGRHCGATGMDGVRHK